MKKYYMTSDIIKKIPGAIFAYWLSDNFLNVFSKATPMIEIANCCTGMQTGNNDKYVKMWHEINYTNTQLYSKNGDWYKYNCGGDARKWYGNHLNLVFWKNNGQAIRNEKSSVVRNEKFFFKKGITWKRIKTSTFSLRYLPEGFIFDQAGDSMFLKENNSLNYILGLVNSTVVTKILECISPSLNLTAGNMNKVPVVFQDRDKIIIDTLVDENIKTSRKDWDSFENSWDFSKHPLMEEKIMSKLLSEKFSSWESECKDRFQKVKDNEETLNKMFIDIYGLNGEIDYEVSDDDITIRLADKEREIKSLISYLVGIEMGRYSLDVEGLAYAGGEWNPMNYVTYQPDDDGIIPIYTQLGMADGLTARIIKLIKHIYGEDTYRENIEFIAEALGKNQNESAEETLNRYLNYGFYADHLKTYQKRPIYWMFSSGKNDAFKCLVYLHRYNEDTLAKINSKYFLNESARLNVEVNETRTLLEAADGREKLRLDKQMKLLNARQKEMIEYGQVLDHMANQYINLDLDDGVKVNYAKFQGIEIVNDSGAKVKKDLLVPIK